MNSKLGNVYAQIPKSNCPEGCGKCCGPIFPSLAELQNIKIYCTEHHIEFRNFLDITEDGFCPYLQTDKRCAIYPVRPFLCRILGTSSVLPCPLGKIKSVKLLNKPQSDALYAAIYLHGKEKPRTEKHRRIVKEVLECLK